MKLLKNLSICMLALAVALSLGCGDDDSSSSDAAGGAGGAGAEGGAGGAGAEGGAGGAGAEGGAGGAGAEGGAGGAGGAEPLPSIADIATGDERFSTLVSLVDSAGLLGLFTGTDEYTVFAPTNAAFEALPQETLDAVMADPDLLQFVLSLHAAPGRVNAESVVAGTLVQTLGGYVSVAVDGENVAVGGAPVSAVDIEASNGIVHVIDSVITDNASIVEIASGISDFETLVGLVVQANLVDALSAEGPLTVFAPTNDAFAALPEETLAAVMDDPELLASVLTHHVINGAVTAADVAAGDVETLGGTVTIAGDADAGWTINGAPIVTTDIRASNGWIHIMGGVIVPAAE